MLVASIPYKFSVPWGASATSSYINTIPETGVSPAASQALGFPPATSVPAGAGGTPPAIGDFNGALNYETLWTQWLQAGAPVGYDSAFSTAIGGYPNGAILASATFGRRWISTVDNNTSNPNTGGANWMYLFWNGAASLNAGTDTGSTNYIALTMSGITAYSQITGIPVTFQLANNITGASVVNINGIGNASLLQGGCTLSGGEGVAPWNYTIVYWAGSFHIIGSGAGAVNVGAPSVGTHAANVNWVNANFANLAQFANSLGANGYQRLPGGLIIQWGEENPSPANTSVTYSFPITFPNRVLSFTTTPVSTTAPTLAALGSVLSASQFSLTTNNGGVGQYWMAIGY